MVPADDVIGFGRSNSESCIVVFVDEQLVDRLICDRAILRRIRHNRRTGNSGRVVAPCAICPDLRVLAETTVKPGGNIVVRLEVGEADRHLDQVVRAGAAECKQVRTGPEHAPRLAPQVRRWHERVPLLAHEPAALHHRVLARVQPGAHEHADGRLLEPAGEFLPQRLAVEIWRVEERAEAVRRVGDDSVDGLGAHGAHGDAAVPGDDGPRAGGVDGGHERLSPSKRRMVRMAASMARVVAP